MKTVFVFVVFMFSILYAATQDTLGITYDSVKATIQHNRLDYRTLSSRLKLNWNDGSGENEFSGSLRSKKDSLIWLSLGMLGIEGARLKITGDSLFIISKLTHENTALPITELQRWTIFPVNYTMLEQIIEGTPPEISPQSHALVMTDSFWVVYEETDKLLQTLWVDTTNYTIQKMLLKDKLLNQSMEITFGRYNFHEGKPFSYHRHIQLKRGDAGAVLKMDILKIATNTDVSFPFETSEKERKKE